MQAVQTATPSLFNFHDQTIRVIQDNQGEPWFVADDVLDILGCPKPSRSKWMEKLLEDEKGKNSVLTPGGSQQMKVITESGLYKLVMRSDKPEAQEFQNWVTREVFPATQNLANISLTTRGLITCAFHWHISCGVR